MLGPKPCPYSYYDHARVVPAGGGYPAYYATSNAGWNGTNIDGIQLPNTDSATSCSALIPLVNPAQTLVTVTTINPSNQNPLYRSRYIRPVSAFAPHYEEDMSFQACAELATPLRDPPLHFAKNPVSGNVAWCAEAYPSQNDNVAYLDVHQIPGGAITTDPAQPYSGVVKPFTSHTSKFTTAGPCTATAGVPAIPAGYPAAGVARHLADTQTCDRTVVNPPNGVSWTRFPLLAPAADVEAALQADESYDCMVSHDPGAKTGVLSPTGGCCGMGTGVWSGAGNPSHNATTAHLEPTAAPNPTACLMPQY